MQALVLTDYRTLELQSVEEPVPRPDEVVVAIRVCGICGSDVHGYDGTSGRRIPPIIMGHEAAGVVVATGREVRHTRAGDHVTFDSTLFCGDCDACRRGMVNLCTARRVLGVSCADYRQNGAFAERLAVPERILHPLPQDLPFEHAALLEPVAVALHAVGRVAVKQGDRAVVVGSGMIGLFVIQALRVAGCGEVIAADVDDARLTLARELGASGTICARDRDVVAAIQDRTGGVGADVAMEVVGSADALATAIGCVRRGGQIGLVGNLAPSVPFPLQSVVTRELTLVGSCAIAGEYPRAIELVASGAIQVAPVISAVAPLEEGPSWFERLYAREPGLMKVVLTPSSGTG